MKTNKIHSEIEISSNDIENQEIHAHECTEIVSEYDPIVTIPPEQCTEIVQVSNQTARDENEIILELRILVQYQKNRIAKLQCINGCLSITVFLAFIIYYTTKYPVIL